MIRIRWLLLGLLLVCVTAILVAVAILSPAPGLTTANFERIEVGMTRAEVETIIGEPPIDYGTRLAWESEEGFNATIVLDDDDRVRSKHIFSHWADGRTTLQKMRDFLLRRQRPPEPEQMR